MEFDKINDETKHISLENIINNENKDNILDNMLLTFKIRISKDTRPSAKLNPLNSLYKVFNVF